MTVVSNASALSTWRGYERWILYEFQLNYLKGSSFARILSTMVELAGPAT